MKRRAGLTALLMAFALQGCIDGAVVLHVAPDGHGRAVITSRLFEPSVLAFDSMFSDSPKHAKTEDLLPPPGPGELSEQFGTAVKLASTKLDLLRDGGLRTTVVEFEDVTRLRIAFPPIFAMPGGTGSFGIGGLSDRPVISFAMKPHDNGDRLLLVRLPQERIDPGPDPDVTVFKTDSPEEKLFKLAIKGLALKFFVELDEVQLLRTNAPASKAGRATILDLDLDKVINNLDENKVRRAMTPGSMQEVLWQLGDMPGAIVPREHEVFLEFEGPQAPPQAAAPAAQAPPDTEIYLAPMRVVNGAIEFLGGPALNITNNPGYDNQPFFTPDGRSVLFTSVRGPMGSTQTDIYRYDIPPRQVVQVTRTPESEYSPTVTPSGNLSVIRVELDEAKTQRLWQFTLDGRDPRPVLENVKPVGYHVWADDHTLALFVLGAASGLPSMLQLADTRTGTAVVLGSDVGRSMQKIPGTTAISFVQRYRSENGVGLIGLVIQELNPATREISTLTPAPSGSTEADTAWTPDGTLLVVKGGVLYGWKRGDSGWKEIIALERLSLSGVTRLAVSPRGDYLALVAPPRQSR
jgi:WD40 repeat protein